VIVFDRIRENVPRMPRATFSQIANRAMSEVLTRSLATSFAVLLPVGSLLVFGGATLRDFAFALLVGVASGAYSSIFIATPVLMEWKEREPVYMRRRKLVMQDHDGVVPAFASVGLGEGSPRAARPRRERPAAAPQPSGAGATSATRSATAAPPRPRQAPPPQAAAPTPPPDGDGGNGADAKPPRPKPKQKQKPRGRKKHGRR
jgi:SecD/SecF fusion protein